MDSARAMADENTNGKAQIPLEIIERYTHRWDDAVAKGAAYASQGLHESAAMARLAIQTCFLLNGAALAALPAFVGGLGIPKDLLIFPACLFIAGIVAASVATVSGYLNFQVQQISSGVIVERDIMLAAESLGLRHPLPNKTKEQIVESVTKADQRLNTTSLIGLISVVASLSVFVFACFELLNSLGA